MTSFTNTPVGFEHICNADCTVLFTKNHVTVLSTGGKTILTGWREKELKIIWCFALKPTKELLMHHTTESRQKNHSTYSEYDIPSMEARARYMHAASGFPVK